MYTISPRGERNLLWLLAPPQLTLIVDFMVMMPLRPQIMHAFQITPTGFATAVSAYSWCSGLSRLLAATYIERFDRCRLLLSVYALFALSNFACARATSFLMLLVARAFAGITGGLPGSAIMTVVADVIPIARRGAATGVIMTAFSLAAIAGVPAGVVPGAHFGWSAPFGLLAALSAPVWLGCIGVVRSLAVHLAQQAQPVTNVLPALWSPLTRPRRLKAFALTFVVMLSQMLVIPFIAPVLSANYRIQSAQMSWLYMTGRRHVLHLARYRSARRPLRASPDVPCIRHRSDATRGFHHASSTSANSGLDWILCLMHGCDAGPHGADAGTAHHGASAATAWRVLERK